MSGAVVNILEQINNLSSDDRSELLLNITGSSDAKITPGAEQAWLEESNKRFEEIKSGKAKIYSHEEIKAMVLES